MSKKWNARPLLHAVAEVLDARELTARNVLLREPRGERRAEPSHPEPVVGGGVTRVDLRHVVRVQDRLVRDDALLRVPEETARDLGVLPRERLELPFVEPEPDAYAVLDALHLGVQRAQV